MFWVDSDFYMRALPGSWRGEPWPWLPEITQPHPQRQAQFVMGDGHVETKTRNDVLAMSPEEQDDWT